MEKSKDIIGEITGEWGKWQRRTVFLIFLCKIPSAWFMACIIFTAPAARDGEFFCKPPVGTLMENKTNWIQHVHPETIISESYGTSIDFCHVYDNFRTHLIDSFHYFENKSDPFSFQTEEEVSIVPCGGFQHESAYDSLVTQFDLVCSRTILVAWTQFWHLFGVLNGGIFATILLEFFSPRRVMLLGMITQIFCGCLTGLVNDFTLHCFFRYLSAVCCAQMYTAGQVIFSDITGGKYRKSVICLFESFWGLGVILLPLLSYIVHSWTSIYLAISLPTLFYIILWHWIPDSPRWLLKRGLIEETKDILMQSVEVNERKYIIPSDFEECLHKQASQMQNEPAPLGWWSIWDGPKAILTMIALHTAWAVYVTNYNGMLLNIRAFGRDYIYVNTAVAGFCEILGVLIAWFFVMNTQQIWLWTGLFNIAAGIISCTGFLMPTNFPEPLAVSLIMLTAMLAKTATTCSQTVLVASTGELVPAVKQKVCIFSCIVFARIWLLTAPFIGVITFVHYLAPLAAFGLLGLVGGIATCYISRRQNGPKVMANEMIVPDIWTVEITRL